MRKRLLILAGVLAFLFLLRVVFIGVLLVPHGRTTGSRQEMLMETGFEYYASGQEIPPGTMLGEIWRIEEEVTVGDYIVSGAYSLDGRAAVVLFEPGWNGRYKVFSKRIAGQNEIIMEHLVVNGKGYDVIWFCGAPTLCAQVTTTVEGGQSDTVQIDTTQSALIISESQVKNYTLDVVYCGSDGTVYE